MQKSLRGNKSFILISTNNKLLIPNKETNVFYCSQCTHQIIFSIRQKMNTSMFIFSKIENGCSIANEKKTKHKDNKLQKYENLYKSFYTKLWNISKFWNIEMFCRKMYDFILNKINMKAINNNKTTKTTTNTNQKWWRHQFKYFVATKYKFFHYKA